MPWCVIGDDQIIMGAGTTHEAALENAKPWLEEAARYQLDTEIIFAKKGEHKSLDLDMHWRIRPCSEKVVSTLDEKGGHKEWMLVDGVVVLNEEVPPVDTSVDKEGA